MFFAAWDALWGTVRMFVCTERINASWHVMTIVARAAAMFLKLSTACLSIQRLYALRAALQQPRCLAQAASSLRAAAFTTPTSAVAAPARLQPPAPRKVQALATAARTAHTIRNSLVACTWTHGHANAKQVKPVGESAPARGALLLFRAGFSANWRGTS